MFDPRQKTRKPNKTNKYYLSYGVLHFDSKTSKDTNLNKNSHKALDFNNSAEAGNDDNHKQLRKNYRDLSPESRAEAVARGQRELMEMVKDMPESCYELTLKDIVEQRHQKVEDDVESARKRDAVKKTSRSGSETDGGGEYLLKMGIPFGSKMSKRKKQRNVGTKVSPRPSVDGSAKGIGFSSESSSNSSKSSNRKCSETHCCWSFLWTKG